MGTGEGVVTLPKVARKGTVEITFEWALHRGGGSSRHMHKRRALQTEGLHPRSPQGGASFMYHWERTNAEQEVQVTRAFLGGWRWETSGILGQHWHSISSFGVTCELDHCAQHGASEKLHYDSQMLLEDKLQLSWRLPISVLKWGQEQTHLVLPREMNFKRSLDEQNSS